LFIVLSLVSRLLRSMLFIPLEGVISVIRISEPIEYLESLRIISIVVSNVKLP